MWRSSAGFTSSTSAKKKDEVIGKAVSSEDIPAATQLFTPNWIVQYPLQNEVSKLSRQTIRAART
jgi:type II restriction/modification system DNA methylase subunit YeeA